MAPIGVVARWIRSGGGGDDGRGGGTSEADDVIGTLFSGMKEGGGMLFDGGGKRGGGGTTIIGGRVLSTTDGTAEVVRWRRAASSVIDSIADSIDWRRSDCDCEGSGRMAPKVAVESRSDPPDIGEEGGGELVGTNWNCPPAEPTLNNPIGEVGAG